MCGLRVRFRQSPERRGVFEYALRVEVVRSEDMPSKIFVYHQSPAGIEGNTFAEFDHIATPTDFHEIPEDAASETVPWFRTDKCVVWLRSASDLQTAKQLFVDDISALLRTYNAMTGVNDFIDQTTLDFKEDDVRVHGRSDDIEEIKEEIEALEENKVDKDALADKDLSVATIEKIRESLVITARALGANIVWSEEG